MPATVPTQPPRSAYLAPLRKLLARSGRGLVLAAHGVTRRPIRVPLEQVHMRTDDFIAIVELLRDLDFEFLSMAQVTELSRRSFAHSRHWTHLTFDDGYQNLCADILPWLTERGIPFSVFVSTHHVETGSLFPTFYARYAHYLGKDLAPLFGVAELASADAAESMLKFSASAAHEMRLQQILALLDSSEQRAMDSFVNEQPMDVKTVQHVAKLPGVHIGSHMHHHWLFHREQPPDAMRRDLATSIERLTSTWRVSNRPTFCFPNGNYDANSQALLREFGIELAFTSQSGFVDETTDALLVPRFTMTNRSRTLGICALCAFGNRSLRWFGRRPPALTAA